MLPDPANLEDEIAAEEAALLNHKRLERLDVLGAMLMVKARQQISARSVVEQRWLEDVRQYNGRYDVEIERDLKEAKKSRVFLGLTRSKVNVIRSRLSNLLFPTDDKNYSIKPTPVPELAKDPEAPAADQGGNPIVDDASGEPMSRGDVADRLQDESQRRAKLMEAEIDDQLTEAGYPGKAREAIHQAVLLGTGVLKGPIVVGRVRKAYEVQQDGTWSLTVKKDLRPAVEWVDVWNFYPDMSVLRQQDLEFCFERRPLSKKALQALRDNPHYIAENIQEVLQMEPRQTQYAVSHTRDLRLIHGTETLVEDTHYESWAYSGPIKADDLRDCGCQIPEDQVDDLFGCVEICGGKVIKAYIDPLDIGEIPYSMYVFERDETSIFGFGVPYELRDPQRVANAAWRMLLDNLGLSVAPQIIINKGMGLRPVNGVWELVPGKFWEMTDEQGDVRRAFGQFQIESNQQALTALLKDALELADQTTNTPLIAQGQQQVGQTKTEGGLAMLMNAAGTVPRESAKSWDDGVTKPLLSRFYHYNMQYSAKDEIKGDFEVDARGASVLVTKEIQAQNLMILGANFGQSAVYGPLMKPLEMLRRIVEAHHLSADEIVLSDEEYEAQQKKAAEAQQPSDPRVAAEQARAQARMEELKYDRETKYTLAEAQREIEFAKLAQEQNLSVEQFKVLLRQTEIKETGQLARTQMKAESDMAYQAREIDVKQTFGSGL